MQILEKNAICFLEKNAICFLEKNAICFLLFCLLLMPLRYWFFVANENTQVRLKKRCDEVL